jgi:RNA polymerase sigma-70 factor (ECF subfamily)
MPNSTPEELDIDALVRFAQEGDKDAFAQIYDHFFDPIYRYVFFRVPKSEVDDIVETIFIKAWVKLEKYEKRDVSFGAWLYRVAHNSVIDHRRVHRPILPIDYALEDTSGRSAPKKLTEQSLLADKVRVEIAKLKDPYKQVISLKFLSGLSNTEIAEILGEREGNIRVLQFRALKKLKQQFTEAGIEHSFL